MSGTIAIAGAGAFGTSLAIAFATAGRDVVLWGRDGAQIAQMQTSRQNAHHLPGISLPPALRATSTIGDLAGARALLLAVPMQALAPLLRAFPDLGVGQPMIACCKGLDLASLQGPSTVIRQVHATADIGVLTGPSFASDIAAGLPTALTLAFRGADAGALQELLSTPTLRLYLSDDVTGAELGGALKNVIAIAAGVAKGAGLGASAQAAIITRGFAEMQRLVVALGGQADTLTGLSGLGDLVLTCSSDQSRNFSFGLALGASGGFDPAKTVEGKATAIAVARLCAEKSIDMPITQMIAALVLGEIPLNRAISLLMSRPLTKE